MTDLDALRGEVAGCNACGDLLPLGARPVFQLSSTATILIASQAPGTKAHVSGIPFSDRSGDRLRSWLGLSEAQFYDASKIAIVPMGLCYPGRAKNGGDAPPRPECAPLWRARLLAQMPALKLTLLVGTYAQTHVLGPGTMTGRVRQAGLHRPHYFALPHPSWRSRHWAADNPWFEHEVLPRLRGLVSRHLLE